MKKNVNQSSMASLLARKTEPKVVVKFDSSEKFIFIPTFGPVLLYIKFSLTSWFQNFSLIIILFTWEAVLSDFSGSLKCILNIPQNMKKIECFLKISIFFVPKSFFIIILCNSFFIDSPQMMISSVVVDLLEWKVLYWIFLSGHCTQR